MTALLSKRITNNDIALEIIEAFEPKAKIEDGKVVVSAACQRCGGSGNGGWYQDGGICYECGGVNTSKRVQRIAVKAYASKIKAKKRAETRRREKAKSRAEAALEGQRNWSEANGHGRLTFAELDAKRLNEREAKRAAEKLEADDVVVGRHEFTGTVLKTEFKSNAYGGRMVMTVKEDRGFILWGSIPSSLEAFEVFRSCPDTGDTWTEQRGLDRGDRVKFVATAEMSDRDSKFGFFKRPAKAELLAEAE